MVIEKVDKEETIKLQKREKRGSKTCNLLITDKKLIQVKHIAVIINSLSQMKNFSQLRCQMMK